MLFRSNEQDSLELVLGEPLPEERSEVIYQHGVPVLRQREGGAAPLRPWSHPAVQLPLEPLGHCGVDRLRLRFSINGRGELEVEGEDLLTGTPLSRQVLGTVR